MLGSQADPDPPGQDMPMEEQSNQVPGLSIKVDLKGLQSTHTESSAAEPPSVAASPAQSEADDEANIPTSKPVKRLIRRSRVLDSDDSNDGETPGKIGSPTRTTASEQDSTVTSEGAETKSVNQPLNKDKAEPKSQSFLSSDDDTDYDVRQKHAKSTAAKATPSASKRSEPGESETSPDSKHTRKSRASTLLSESESSEDEKQSKCAKKSAEGSEKELTQYGEKGSKHARKSRASRLLTESESSEDEKQSKRAMETADGSESSEDEQQTKRAKETADESESSKDEQQSKRSKKSAEGSEKEDGEEDRPKPFKPRAKRQSVRDQLRSDGLLDSSDEEDMREADQDDETQRMTQERENIRKAQQRIMRKTGEIRYVKPKKMSLDALKQRILGNSQPAKQTDTRASLPGRGAATNGGPARTKTRTLDAFLTADKKPFAFSPNGKVAPDPKPAPENEGGDPMESGCVADDDDLVVLDQAPANRTTLRQNLMRIAATERAKAKEGKTTIRLEDEEEFDEEEYLENEEDGEGEEGEDEKAGEGMEGEGGEGDGSDGDEERGEEEGAEESASGSDGEAEPESLLTAHSTDMLENSNSLAQTESQSTFSIPASYIPPNQRVATQIKATEPVMDTQDLGSMFRRTDSYAATQQPDTNGDSLLLDEDGFFRRPTAGGVGVEDSSGVYVDPLGPADSQNEPLTNIQLKSQFRPTQFKTALNDMDIQWSGDVIDATGALLSNDIPETQAMPEDSNVGSPARNAADDLPRLERKDTEQLLTQSAGEDDDKENQSDGDSEEEEEEEEVVVKKIGAVVDAQTLEERRKKMKEKKMTMFDEEAELSGDELESDEDEDKLDEGEDETVADEEVEAGDEEAMRRRHVENVLHDDEAEVEAIKAGVMGYKRKGDFDDIEAQLAAAARRANARFRRGGEDDSDDSQFMDGFEINLKDKLWDGHDMGPDDVDEVEVEREKLAKMSYLMQQQEANSRKALDSLLDADSQHILSRIASTSKLMGAPRRPPLRQSNSLPAPLKRFGSVSSTTSFLNRQASKPIPKPASQTGKPDAPHVLRATSSRGSFVFSTNSRDSLSNQAPGSSTSQKARLPAKPTPYVLPGKPGANGKKDAGKPQNANKSRAESLFAALSKNKFDIKQAK